MTAAAPGSADFARAKPTLVRRAVETFADPRYGVGTLKFDWFEASLRMAVAADCGFAGFMCGRSIWADAVGIFGAQGETAMRTGWPRRPGEPAARGTRRRRAVRDDRCGARARALGVRRLPRLDTGFRHHGRGREPWRRGGHGQRIVSKEVVQVVNDRAASLHEPLHLGQRQLELRADMVAGEIDAARRSRTGGAKQAGPAPC